jgi:hypothetical protein
MRSPIMIEVRLVLALGTVGMIDASATTSPSMAWHRPNWSTTASASSASAMVIQTVQTQTH